MVSLIIRSMSSYVLFGLEFDETVCKSWISEAQKIEHEVDIPPTGTLTFCPCDPGIVIFTLDER